MSARWIAKPTKPGWYWLADCGMHFSWPCQVFNAFTGRRRKDDQAIYSRALRVRVWSYGARKNAPLARLLSSAPKRWRFLPMTAPPANALRLFTTHKTVHARSNP